MIVKVNGIKVKTVYALQMEEVNKFVYHFDIEFVDNTNYYHHVTSDDMGDITAVSSTGNILRFEFIGLERIYTGKVAARHRVYFNSVEVGIS